MSSLILSGMVRVGSHILREHLAGPTRFPDIPSSFRALSPEWLTAALCAKHPGARVLAFTCDGASSGSTTRCFINLSYNDVGIRAGLPQRVFAKAAHSFTSRMIGLSGVFEAEVEFFLNIRPHLDIEAPEAYYSGVHTPSLRYLILLKERSECTFLDPTVQVSRPEVEDMASLLARLHATLWNSPRFAQDLNWLKSAPQLQQHMNQMIGFESCSMVGIERASAVIPQELLRRRLELWPATLRSLDLNAEGDQTLLHHDVHIGNWYRTPTGRMGLTDWQPIVRGNWACDFAYAMSCAMTVENRRAWEGDVLKLYLEKLREYGVPTVPCFEAAWKLYRQQLFHGFIFWVFTIGRSALQPRMQPDHFSLINIERFANALADHDSLGSLRS